MATADKLSYLNTTKGKIKDSINLTGANITNETTFRNYAVLLKDTLANGIGDIETFKDTLINNFPKTTATGTNISITAYSTWLNLSLKGDTYQNGTPTPTTPINIDVVSGLQEVDIVGKNLFDKSKVINGKIVSRIDGIIVNSSSYSASDYIPMEENTTYTLDGAGTSTESFNRWYSACYDKNKNYIGYVPNENTFTTLPNTRYMRFSVYTAKLDTALLVKGNRLGEYETYKGKTYDINLGKNLAETSNSIPTIQELTITNQDNGKILVNGTNTAMRFAKICDMTNINIPQGTYTISVRDNEGNNYAGDMYYTINGVQNYKYKSNGASMQITTDGVITKLSFSIYFPVKTYNNTEIYIQLEKGNQATSYSEYFTPIELCKIGTYQDYIYKDNGSWYLHKEIGKVVLNGVEGNWTLASSTSDYYEYQNYNVLTISSPSGYTFPLSNYFSDTTNNRVVANGKTLLIRVLASAGITTANDFKTWLSTHNTIVYYVLANPTTEEITNSELVSQLNAIELIDGLNNISASGDLPTIMEVIGLEKE